jgi:hypothetical protein
MPVIKCSNGKYRIGSGGCIYDSKAKAERAYKGYLAQKHMNEVKEIKNEIMKRKKELEVIRKILRDMNDK